jgi:hypothetical protein
MKSSAQEHASRVLGSLPCLMHTTTQSITPLNYALTLTYVSLCMLPCPQASSTRTARALVKFQMCVRLLPACARRFSTARSAYACSLLTVCCLSQTQSYIQTILFILYILPSLSLSLSCINLSTCPLHHRHSSSFFGSCLNNIPSLEYTLYSQLPSLAVFRFRALLSSKMTRATCSSLVRANNKQRINRRAELAAHRQ